jgi:hypothetical protein
MLVTEIDTYEGEELLENYPINRTIVFEKAERQELFEKWLNKTQSSASIELFLSHRAHLVEEMNGWF